MTIKLPVVGGPRDGEVREYDHLGTTWSRSDVFDENGECIGLYHCDGPGATEITFIPIEQYRAWLAGVEYFIEQLEVDKEWTDMHVEKLLKEQNATEI